MIVETKPQWKNTVHFDGEVLWTFAAKQTDADFGGIFYLLRSSYSSKETHQHWDAMYELVVLHLDKCCMLHHATCSCTVKISCENAFPHEGDLQSSRVQEISPQEHALCLLLSFSSSEIFSTEGYTGQLTFIFLQKVVT